MDTPTALGKPPITEALLDIRIAQDARLDLARLQPLRDQFADSYPVFEEKRHFEAQFQVQAGKMLPPQAIDLGFGGVWLTNTDGSRVVQFRPDGFTFNNVVKESKVYMGGDGLINEALRLWSAYRETAQPGSVVRVALRYLNRLDLPFGPQDEFDRFLTAAPGLPPSAPQVFSSFLSRAVAHEENRQVVVTQKFDASASGGGTVLIDIDAFMSGEWSPDPNEIRGQVELLRELKNRVFFSLLTPETVKLYS